METFEFNNVSFIYPNTEVPALQEITFYIRESEFIVICGASGSGKTTLLRHMKKNMIPHGRGAGSLRYRGLDIEVLENRINAAEIGYVQQNPENQIVTDKVWHELAFGLESLGYANTAIKKKTAEIAEYFGISEWFGESVWNLSGGQKQIMNLAAVMVMDPKVLILDEPTAQLDPIAAAQFIEALGKINRDFGTTIILTEHRLEEVFPMADRVMVMDGGRIIQFDTAQNIARTVQLPEVTQGLPSAVKIFTGITQKLSSIRKENCPITVKEGRLWLNDICKDFNMKNVVAAEISVKSPKQKDNRDRILKLSKVSFRYEKHQKDVISGVDLEIKKGELFALLGGNGAGKTSILRLIAGVKKPYQGKISAFGKVAALAQNPQAMFTEITVEEELAEVFAEKPAQAEKQEIIEKIDAMLLYMDLEGYRKLNPYDLSGGQQQKLAIAKILLLEPDIILLDEPTKGLDPYFKQILASSLKGLCEKGITILMVSHDIEFCAEYADRCAMLFEGEIVASGFTKEFFCENSFYTTAASRMSRHLLPGCVTCKDIVDKYLQIRRAYEADL